jgi:type IV secretion system protein VirB6
MACPVVTTGNEFLVRTLSHLDCQAQTLGSFGFQSLSLPGSPAAVVLSGLLTLFIALYGMRLLFRADHERSDLVNAALKIGIVLTIAASWPAWRIVAYDTVLHGPAEIAASIMPSTLPDPRADFPQRLQTIDTGIAALTAAGTGRQTGRVTDAGFRPIALQDEAGFGWSRSIYLASTIGSLATFRIAGGLLLALAPLLAGLMLFDATRGLFAGWLRGLALVALGSLGLTVLLSVQAAIMEPWLADVLNRRTLGYATPTAPTELLALVTAFAIATAGLLFILGKVAFQNAWATHRPVFARLMAATNGRDAPMTTVHAISGIPIHSRAAAIGESVAGSVRREELQTLGFDSVRRIGFDRPSNPVQSSAGSAPAPAVPLGSAYRRGGRRETSSQQRRDDRK